MASLERDREEQSPEEEDLLARSTKRVKGLEIEVINNSSEQKFEGEASSNRDDGKDFLPDVMETDTEMAKENEGVQNLLNLELGEIQRAIVSYRDKLLGFNVVLSKELEVEQMGLEDLDVGEEVAEENEEDLAYLVIQVIEEENKELCRP